MCEPQNRVLDIFAGYSGSTHDSRVQKDSHFFIHQKYPPEGYYILADGEFPCLSQPVTIITPHREPNLSGQHNDHNYCACRCESVKYILLPTSEFILKSMSRSSASLSDIIENREFIIILIFFKI